MPRQRSGGFTLVELLVVMMVVSILAGLLFPAFRQSKRDAQRTSCAGNLRQIGGAFHLYAADYDDRLPCALDRWHRDRPWMATSAAPPGVEADAMPDLVDVLRSYVGVASGVWKCPADHYLYFDTEIQIPSHPSYSDYADTSYLFEAHRFGATLSEIAQDPYGTLATDAIRLNHSLVQRPTMFDKTMNRLYGDGHVAFN